MENQNAIPHQVWNSHKQNVVIIVFKVVIKMFQVVVGICSNSNGENNVEELLRRKKSSCDSVAVNGS